MKTLSYLSLIGMTFIENSSAMSADKDNVLTYNGPDKGFNTNLKTKLIAWDVQPVPYGIDFATVKMCESHKTDIDNIENADYKQDKPSFTLYSGSCEDMKECATYCETAFNWWAANSGYGCVEMFYASYSSYGYCNAWTGSTVVDAGTKYKEIMESD